MHEDYEYVKSLEKEVDELESEKADFSNIYDLLLKECVSKDVTCSYLHSLSDLNAHTLDYPWVDPLVLITATYSASAEDNGSAVLFL
ncbi:hypothetical protein Tco_0839952 [Tanacetum coccineum]|uniref:Uncharacterized protein n=1 Tax=Tanacetum coccineum TaxID=301880 RepID=A0ABQ5ASS0_9ASTR